VTRQQSAGRRLHRRVKLLLVLAIIASELWGGPASAAPRYPERGAWFGAYVDAPGSQNAFQAVRAFERMIGRKARIVNRYHPFSDHDYDFERRAARGGRIVMVSWRATSSTTDGSRAQKIARGDYDGLIRNTADAIRRIPGTVLLRFNWEMDQSPGERQYIGPPADFIRAWRHIVSIFRGRGVHDAQFTWVPRSWAFANGDAQAYWPGARYVDWIGASGVFGDQWNSFARVNRQFYRWGRRHHRPLLIWSGVRERPSSPGWKADFFSDAGRVIRRWRKVKAWVYYHAASPEGDAYWVDTSARSLASYRRVGGLHWFHPERFGR
jgi:hypothetical protein